MTGLSLPFHFDLHLIKLSVFFIVFFTELTNSERRCQERFIYFQNDCYYFSSQQVHFWLAQSVCNNYSDVSNPCYLTSIHSEAENNFVYQRATQRWGTASYWLGAIKTTELGKFSWLDGSQMNFTQLKTDEMYGECLQQWTKEKEWIYTYCVLNKYFVCKQTAQFSFGVCSSNPCQNGGTCNTQNNSFSCECRTEFSGDTCEVSDYMVFRRRQFITITSASAVFVFLVLCAVFGCGFFCGRKLVAKGKEFTYIKSSGKNLEPSNHSKSIRRDQEEIRGAVCQQESIYTNMLDSDGVKDPWASSRTDSCVYEVY